MSRPTTRGEYWRTAMMTGGLSDGAAFAAFTKSTEYSSKTSANPVTTAYNITVTNNGPLGATNVAVIDTLPGSGTTFNAATTTQGTFSVSGSTVTFNVGFLASGASKTMTGHGEHPECGGEPHQHALCQE